jgi:hypothetical protein
MRKLTPIVAIAALVTFIALSVPVQGGTLTATTSSATLRASAIVTTSKVLSTTASLATVAPGASAVHIYPNVSLAGATSISVIPCYTFYDNVGTGTYWEVTDYAKTYTTTGTYTIRVPREYLGSGVFGVKVVGVGTMTSTDCVVSYKTEQP